MWGRKNRDQKGKFLLTGGIKSMKKKGQVCLLKKKKTNSGKKKKSGHTRVWGGKGSDARQRNEYKP